MRLFKSNKSQASIDRSTGSRSGSPTIPDAAYPQTQSQQQHQQQPPQLYGGAHPHSAHPDRFGHQSFDDTHYQVPQGQPHPAQILTRSQSNRASTGADAYTAHLPTTNIVPQPLGTGNIPEIHAPIPGQTSFGQSRQVHTEKEHKRSKRSIFGLGSSKDKEKENSPTERKALGRAGSVHLLRKTPLVQPPTDSQPQSPQQLSPQYHTGRQSVYLAPSDSSNENIPQDPSYYDQHRPQQGQYESPQSQYSHQPPEYTEDKSHFSPPREQYQAYQQPEHENTSEQYLPYQGQQGRPLATAPDQYQNLRPPSQASLGPPSPLANAAQQDSRPSTATNTSRFSTQSVSQPPSLAPMARGDVPNGSLRQQISQQRDPRSGDDHSQYQSQQDPRMRMPDQGRSTPPPRNREDVNNLDYHQLLQRHEELQAKYSKVKRYYFEREAQVTHLQNTVANQRLSMSKTSLDDAQYTSRFERLSGAINNLAFNIRKNWRGIPAWLRPVCNQDAPSIGTKEMTAVGRACITRWLYDTVFERIFHPGIDPLLSKQLKDIERNLRRSNQAGLLTDEQRDDLTTKIITWRLTTVEGLQDVLSSRQSQQYLESLTFALTDQLTKSLQANLNDPPPAGLSEGVATIIGQAIGICSNLPLESRDICIEYHMPGALINEIYMKVESGMTPLTNPGLDERLSMQQQQFQEDQAGDTDTASAEGGDRDRDVEAEIREASAKASQIGAGSNGGNNQSSSAGPGSQRTESTASMQSSGSQSTIKSGEKQQGNSKKSSFLGGFVNKKPAPQARGGPPQMVSPAEGVDARDERSVRESMAIEPGSIGLIPGGNNEGKIRFAAFLAVEVRGKGSPSGKDGSGNGGTGSGVNVLCKAPIYEF